MLKRKKLLCIMALLVLAALPFVYPEATGGIQYLQCTTGPAGWFSCDGVLSHVERYSGISPTVKSITLPSGSTQIPLTSIACDSETGITIGYYDTTNTKWVLIEERTVEIVEGKIKVTVEQPAINDYQITGKQIDLVVMEHPDDCVYISCGQTGQGSRGPPLNVIYMDTARFYVCNPLYGCKASKNDVCDTKCSGNLDPDCITESRCNSIPDGIPTTNKCAATVLENTPFTGDSYPLSTDPDSNGCVKYDDPEKLCCLSLISNMPGPSTDPNCGEGACSIYAGDCCNPYLSAEASRDPDCNPNIVNEACLAVNVSNDFECSAGCMPGFDLQCEYEWIFVEAE